jgi:hypothetical protein
MAGTFLILQKDRGNPDALRRLRTAGEAHIRELFAPYFHDIRFYSPDTWSWLVHFRKNGEPKFISGSEGWMIFEGTVFDLRETRMHDINSLWERYRSSANIDDFANALDGHFVIKLYDARKKIHYVLNDFIKDKTQYFCETEAWRCYSSYSYLTAAIREPEPDLQAVNEYMWRYYILSERSFLRGTRRMKAASVHEIGNGDLHIRHYWQWPRQFSREPFRRQVESMTENMRETARLLGGNFHPNLDFTQGQDSRQNVAAMLDQKQAFTTSIFGKADFYEVRATADMARRYGIEHHPVVLKRDFTEDPLSSFEKAVVYGSAEEPGQQLGRILYMREQQLKWGNAVCNGMDGHFYKNGLWDEMYTFNFYREPRAFNIDMFLDLRMFSQDYDARILGPELRSIKEHSRDYFRDMIERSTGDMGSAPVSMQVDKFDLLHWLNFTVVSNASANSIGVSLSPLLFRRNLEDALRVPVRWKFNLSKFQRAVVYGLHPDLAAEKTDFAGVNMVPKNALTYPFFLFRYGWHQSHRLRDKFLRKLGFHPKTHLQEAWDYLPVYRRLYGQMREHAYPDIGNMALGGILSSAGWKAKQTKFRQETVDDLNEYEYIFKVMTMDRFYHLSGDIRRRFRSLSVNQGISVHKEV